MYLYTNKHPNFLR